MSVFIIALGVVVLMALFGVVMGALDSLVHYRMKLIEKQALVVSLLQYGLLGAILVGIELVLYIGYKAVL